jgi:hypothetical protein
VPWNLDRTPDRAVAVADGAVSGRLYLTRQLGRARLQVNVPSLDWLMINNTGHKFGQLTHLIHNRFGQVVISALSNESVGVK